MSDVRAISEGPATPKSLGHGRSCLAPLDVQVARAAPVRGVRGNSTRPNQRLLHFSQIFATRVLST
jgi:hypothetical protein